MAAHKRKLTALGYHNPDTFSMEDEKQVRNLVVWLEDQKIRLYNTAEREPIRDTGSPYWIGALNKYLADLRCPVENVSDKGAVVAWLLSHAVHLEFEGNASKYNDESINKTKSSSNIDQTSWIHSIDPNDVNLIKGIEVLRNALRVPDHPDHIVVLQAISILIEQRMNPSKDQAMPILIEQKSKDEISEKPTLAVLDEISLGFNVDDTAVRDAAKIIRLLQIHNLRELQTKINQSIVAVQMLSADPKTDESLGKVGR